MSEQSSKMNKKAMKLQDPKKPGPSTKEHLISSKKQRKSENPIRIPPPSEKCSDLKCTNSWICQNSACRATRSIEDTFCKRCSCCICHLFDDNKDPSLWLECSNESGQRGDSCGLSCHIECALQHGKVGVVDLGQFMQLDGSYCCASCGKVSGILGYWKKQLNIAKDARRVDILCYRIFLSYRLLEGTAKFKELHGLIEEAKAKLETEVGPINGTSAKMARGIVSRLSVASDVHSLISLAIHKADQLLGIIPNPKEGSLPAACKFLFEEVTSSSVVIVLIELSTASSEEVKGYKLWYCKTKDETYSKSPIRVLPRAQRRFLIPNLQPCTEYSFRIISYTEASDLGHSEAKCFTKSVEIINKSVVPKTVITNGGSSSDSVFKVQDLQKILKLPWTQTQTQEQGCSEGFCNNGVNVNNCCEVIEKTETQIAPKPIVSVSRELDLNIASVPDLNEELIPIIESSRDEDNGCTLGQNPEADADDDAVSRDILRNNDVVGPLGNNVGNNGSGNSRNYNVVDSEMEIGGRKRGPGTRNGETNDSDSTLINGSPLQFRNGQGSLGENFEYCVKIIRWLECEGYIEKEFRLKLLTWFSLQSNEQERRVVNTFIQTLIDDPSCLAGQLVDSFSDMVSSKRQRNGFCSKLWH